VGTADEEGAALIEAADGERVGSIEGPSEGAHDGCSLISGNGAVVGETPTGCELGWSVVLEGPCEK
jgi:hypothetical protein